MGKKRQTRREQVQEAEKIFSWLVFQRQLAGDLIRTSAKIVHDKEEAANTRVDLHMIAKALAAATKPGSRNAVWQDYQHHFVGDRNRKRFFAELRSLTRRVASACLVSIREPRKASGSDLDESFHWDASLLPPRMAGHVLRVAILHPGVLENFLPRFFVKASDLLTQKSTYRRAMLILHAVPRFGWSDEKHTKMLIKLGALDLLEDGSEVETVKKFIRDLRRRYQKYLNEKA
jgi:hypothetical protein